jgi:hypothetical protein
MQKVPLEAMPVDGVADAGGKLEPSPIDVQGFHFTSCPCTGAAFGDVRNFSRQSCARAGMFCWKMHQKKATFS